MGSEQGDSAYDRTSWCRWCNTRVFLIGSEPGHEPAPDCPDARPSLPFVAGSRGDRALDVLIDHARATAAAPPQEGEPPEHVLTAAGDAFLASSEDDTQDYPRDAIAAVARAVWALAPGAPQAESAAKSGDELYERLAAIQHTIWSHWMLYLLGTKSYAITQEPTGRGLREADVQHWRRQIETPYEHLTEGEKTSDREQVDRFWPLIVAALRAFTPAAPVAPDDLADLPTTLRWVHATLTADLSMAEGLQEAEEFRALLRRVEAAQGAIDGHQCQAAGVAGPTDEELAQKLDAVIPGGGGWFNVAEVRNALRARHAPAPPAPLAVGDVVIDPADLMNRAHIGTIVEDDDGKVGKRCEPITSPAVVGEPLHWSCDGDMAGASDLAGLLRFPVTVVRAGSRT